MRIKTKECPATRGLRGGTAVIFGHPKHSYTEITLRGKRAFRCPRIRPIEIPRKPEYLILDEVRAIRKEISRSHHPLCNGSHNEYGSCMGNVDENFF